jgi:hypothetical protein
VVAVVALVVVLVNGDGPAVQAATPTIATLTAPVPGSPAPGSSTSPSSSSSSGGSGAGTESSPVPIGEAATVGDYDVTVTGVITDADEIVAGANQFNEPPTGQYLVVEMSVQYNGTAEGSVFWDLTYVFNGTDNRQYTDSDCSAVLPEDAIDVPTLNAGGTASFQVCMDVPPAAISGGQLFIEPTMSFDEEERRFFATE